MLEGKVKQIGDEALSGDERMLILFGKEASAAIRQVSILQEIPLPNDYEFTVGGKVVIGDEIYTVQNVGPLVKENFQELGHTVLIFKEMPTEDAILNGVYLAPHKLPQIAADTVIRYE